MDHHELANRLRAELDLVEPIYVIESPGSEDLYSGRTEGETLAKTLGLGSIDVSYRLACDEAMFTQAFSDIAVSILKRPDRHSVMPFIHISAHGGKDGIRLTDTTMMPWDKLSSLFTKLHKKVGHLQELEPILADVPRTSLCLSSCSAFKNYKQHITDPTPFQSLIGPVEDVGWCQSLIGFSTFYYQAFLQSRSYWDAVMAMNAAASTDGHQLFELWAPHMSSGALRALADDLMETYLRREGDAS